MISTPFAEVLAGRRDDFNARVRAAQRRFPGFDTQAFLEFLAGPVDGLVEAVTAVAPERVPATVVAAFDIALELTGRHLIGSSNAGASLDAAWRMLMPRYASLVAKAPRHVLAMLGNAVIHLAGIPDARCDQWLHEMGELAPAIDTVDQLRTVGQIVAWRAGAAHFRTGAIAAAASLPPVLALKAFSAKASSSWAALQRCIEVDPWWHGDDGHARAEREIGCFAGFGGPFPEPPTIRAVDGAIAVRSGDRYFTLFGDAYGAVLLASDRAAFDRLPSDAGRCHHVMQDDVLTIGGQDVLVDLPDRGLTVCATVNTIVIASAFTHAIRLMRRTAP